jgi:hypothetical protein
MYFMRTFYGISCRTSSTVLAMFTRGEQPRLAQEAGDLGAVLVAELLVRVERRVLLTEAGCRGAGTVRPDELTAPHHGVSLEAQAALVLTDVALGAGVVQGEPTLDGRPVSVPALLLRLTMTTDVLCLAALLLLADYSLGAGHGRKTLDRLRHAVAVHVVADRWRRAVRRRLHDRRGLHADALMEAGQTDSRDGHGAPLAVHEVYHDLSHVRDQALDLGLERAEPPTVVGGARPEDLCAATAARRHSP